jgi:virginiamycin A acetyltransferase
VFKCLLILFYRVKNDKLRKFLRILSARLEGGEIYSTTLRSICKIYHSYEVGLYSYGGCFHIDKIPPGTVIGRYGSFASFEIFSRNHPLNYISLHPFFYNVSFGYVKEDIIQRTKLVIGHGVWIGQGVMILPNVKVVGNGAVIGAGTVVTKDVPPYSVVVGNPGKIVKYRFTDKIIKIIEETNWWDKDIEELKKNIDLFKAPFNEKLM